MSSSPDAPPPAFIELRHVERRYPGGTVALRGVTMTIEAGECVAIIGRSGSGKSTLLNILGMLDAPTAGELLLDGVPVAVSDDRLRSAARASLIGFVFQRAHLLGDLTVRQNVELGSAYGDDRARRTQQATSEALAAVGLGHRAEAPARTLSGGEMQRAALARTLVRPARLWLTDEPTGNLDSAQSRDVIDLLRRTAAERGAALVVVTHEPDIAARLDRTITLHDGMVVADTATARTVPRAGGPPESSRAQCSAPASGREKGRRARLVVRNARFALQTVLSQRARTRTHLAAAAVAVALTVTALGLAQSARAQVNSMFDARRAVEVTAQVATTEQAPVPRWAINTDALAAFPGVESVEHWRHHPSTPIANGSATALETDIIEVDAAPGAATSATITWAQGHDERLAVGEVLLGATLAERLGITQLTLRPDAVIAGARYDVVGVLTGSRTGTAASAAFVLATAPSAWPPALHSTIAVQTAPGAARMVAERLPDLVDPYRQTTITTDPVVAADAYRDELEAGVGVSLNVLAGICALAGLGVVIFVSLLGVATRTAEFGVRRAFGARRAEVIVLVMAECTVLSVAGAALGLAAGFTAIMVTTAVAHWQPVFDSALLGIPVVGALVFGLIGGLPPAVTAGRVEPADAVRSG